MPGGNRGRSLLRVSGESVSFCRPVAGDENADGGDETEMRRNNVALLKKCRGAGDIWRGRAVQVSTVNFFIEMKAMSKYLIGFLCLISVSCLSQETSTGECEERAPETAAKRSEPNPLWKFKKVSEAEWADIQKKLARVEQRAEYVRITKKEVRSRGEVETYTYPLSPDTKRALLEEWRSAGPWSERYSDRIIINPAVFYLLEFLDEHQEIVAAMPMNSWNAGWYQPKGQSDYIHVSDKIFSVFPEAE